MAQYWLQGFFFLLSMLLNLKWRKRLVFQDMSLCFMDGGGGGGGMEDVFGVKSLSEILV